MSLTAALCLGIGRNCATAQVEDMRREHQSMGPAKRRGTGHVLQDAEQQLARAQACMAEIERETQVSGVDKMVMKA